MLKQGLVFIGKPSIHLHELICLALYLDAPLALSDSQSFEIAQKFSDIIHIHKLSEALSFTYFVSGFSEVFTNLQPEELKAFFLTNQTPKIKFYHLVEEVLKFKTVENSMFCSSFPHTKQLIPSGCSWINLGPIGFLSFQKHKKALLKILNSFIPALDEARFYMAQIMNDSTQSHITKEQTLDQIEFINLCLSGIPVQKTPTCIAAHGLINPAIELAKGLLTNSEPLCLLALNHKRPILIDVPLRGFYEELNVFCSLKPKDPKNLPALIENYFDFETINREELSKKLLHKYFSKTFFST